MSDLSHQLDISTSHKNAFILILSLAVLAGIIAGFILSRNSTTSSGFFNSSNQPEKSAPVVITSSEVNQSCKDTAVGKLQAKNANDNSDGTHQLVQSSGVKVALTSGNVDLSQYEGKTVKVCGETQKSNNVGWLIDVVKVEVQ